MSILHLLASNTFLTVSKHLASIIGLEAAVLLAEFASTQNYCEANDSLDDEGMFCETAERIEKETTLTAYQQAKAIKVLEKSGMLESKRKGVPARKHYRVNEEQVSLLFQNKLSKNLKTSYQETSKLEPCFFENNNKDYIYINNNKIIKDNNKKDNNKRVIKKEYVSVNDSTLSELVKEKLIDFLKYREEIRKPFKSERGIRSLVAQVEKQEQLHGSSAVISCIDTTMQNGWQGIFWEKISKPASAQDRISRIDTWGQMYEEGDYN